mmetsp:Transcript_21999/g.52583  ORF Transcript_21999/g.52583 Transcript_21999/m.52583 type:complete len:242 (-) Transcript_21999:8-733(-)
MPAGGLRRVRRTGRRRPKRGGGGGGGNAMPGPPGGRPGGRRPSPEGDVGPPVPSGGQPPLASSPAGGAQPRGEQSLAARVAAASATRRRLALANGSQRRARRGHPMPSPGSGPPPGGTAVEPGTGGFRGAARLVGAVRRCSAMGGLSLAQRGGRLLEDEVADGRPPPVRPAPWHRTPRLTRRSPAAVDRSCRGSCRPKQTLCAGPSARTACSAPCQCLLFICSGGRADTSLPSEAKLPPPL